MDAPPPAPPASIIYLSQAGIVADGQSDRAAALQALFDRAGSGQPIEIVNDLKGILVTSGNDVWPNTTVRSLNGATWRLAPRSTRGILRNKHPLASWPAGAQRQDGTRCAAPTPPDDTHPLTDTTHGDFNISIVGGIYDGNRRSGGWPNNGRTPTNDHPVLGRDDLMVSTLQFHGVKHLLLQGVRVWDSPTLGIHIGNMIDVTARDCEIGCPSVIYASNTDGFHINGPSRNVSIDNMHFYQTGDDALPLNADDSMEGTTDGNQAPFFGMNTGWGPITQVTIRGVCFDRCSEGVRLLSATQRIDDVLISDVRGTAFWGPVLIDKYLFQHDAGNIGALTLENVHLASLGMQYDGEAGGAKAPAAGPPREVLVCNTNIESLVLRDVSYTPINAVPWARFTAGKVTMLSVNGFTCHDTHDASNGMKLFQLDGATCTSALFGGVNWVSTHPQGGSVVNNHGAIGQLTTAGVALPVEAKALTGTQPTRQKPAD